MNRIEHREEKWIFPFIEYSPDSDKKLPLVIQLHGAGERGNGSPEEILEVEFGFANLIKAGKEYECLFISPQCDFDTFWAARVESILKFIEQLKAEYNIDEDRIYLTGYSMGGYGTWFTAMAKPDMFAAIAPMCGGGMAWNAGVLNMPIWTFHGMLDDVVSPYHTEEMVKALENNGKNVRYTKYDDVAHGCWDYAYSEELLWWLLEQKRK